MAHKKLNGVQQFTTDTGVGALTLSGVVSDQYRTVSEANLVDGDTVYLRIQHTTLLHEWEVTLCTYNAGIITRSFDVNSFSATGALVNFSAGSKIVSGVIVAGDFINYTPLNPTNNLSDVSDVAAARTNLGVVGLGDFMVVDSIADLAVLTAAGTFAKQVQVRSYYAGGNVGGGLLNYAPGASDTIDNGSVFDAPSGRYYRVIQGQGYRSDEFGVLKDKTFGQGPQMQALFTAAKNARLAAIISSCAPGNYINCSTDVGGLTGYILYWNSLSSDLGAPVDSPTVLGEVSGNLQNNSGGAFLWNALVHVGVGSQYTSGGDPVSGKAAFANRNAYLANFRVYGGVQMWVCQYNAVAFQVYGQGNNNTFTDAAASSKTITAGFYAPFSYTLKVDSCRFSNGVACNGIELDGTNDCVLINCATDANDLVGLLGVKRLSTSASMHKVTLINHHAEGNSKEQVILSNMDNCFADIQARADRVENPYPTIVAGSYDSDQPSGKIYISGNIIGLNVNAGGPDISYTGDFTAGSPTITNVSPDPTVAPNIADVGSKITADQLITGTAVVSATATTIVANNNADSTAATQTFSINLPPAGDLGSVGILVAYADSVVIAPQTDISYVETAVKWVQKLCPQLHAGPGLAYYGIQSYDAGTGIGPGTQTSVWSRKIFKGDTTSGSPVFSGLVTDPSAEGITAGMSIWLAGFDTAAKVVSVTANSITLDGNCNTTAVGVWATVLFATIVPVLDMQSTGQFILAPFNAPMGAASLVEIYADDTHGVCSVIDISTDAVASYFSARKARGTPDTKTAVVNSDIVGGLKATAWSGAAWVDCGAIHGKMHETTPGSSAMGMKWQITCTSQGSTNPSVILDIDKASGVQANGVLLCSDTSIGLTTGAGGTVTQLTSKATTVVLSKSAGRITMNNANLVAGTSVSFTLTNTVIAATDFLHVKHESAGTLGSYSVRSVESAGSATITVTNTSAGDLAEAIVLKFLVIKSVVS